MKQSTLFSKTQKFNPQDEESLNAKLLLRAGYVYKIMAGVYSFLPLGLMTLKNIENIVRKHMVSAGGSEIYMSALHPKSAWEVTGRYDTLDVLFRFTSFYSRTDYVLGPTHEEIVTPLVKTNVSSYRDLPVSVFQFQWKFRDEKRAKSGLMRGREFYMKDLYSFHTNQEDLDNYYETMIKAYTEVFKELGIGDKTVLTYAAGGTFSKYSHEFQMITDAGEDLIHLCEKCRVAVNDEIYEELNTCPVCGEKNLQPIKAAEVGNIFKLGTKFSKAFDMKFKDKDGESKEVIMGCYGIGVSRLLGAIVEASHDDKGMILPEGVAPFKFHLIETKKGLGEELYKKMTDEGLSVLYDDRDVSAGEKFADADLLGLPIRLVVSEKLGDKIEVKRRAKEELEILNYEDIRKL